MRKFYQFMTIILTMVFVTVVLCSCGSSSTYKYTPTKVAREDVKLAVKEELPKVTISEQELSDFYGYIGYDDIEIPYSELFGIQQAFAKKDSMNFDVSEHTYDFFDGNYVVDTDKLYKVVLENNKKYMNDGVGKHFYEEFEDSDLMEYCGIVAKTVNWGLENVEGIDVAELGCILGNLKIFDRDSMNYGVFNENDDLLYISSDMIESKNDSSDFLKSIVTHETMHLLQCRCTDVVQGEEDAFIGVSYLFENLEINPLKISWLYEASAEINTTEFLNSEPTTYKYMIDSLESLNLATVLNDNVKVNQLKMLCFTQNDELLYNQFEFNDRIKTAEFLYSVELLCSKPDDFRKVYEKAYGAIDEDYLEFLRNTYLPCFVQVTSELLYKNLALKLTKNEISLSDVFYIISLYELDLIKYIPLDNASLREKNIDVYNNYIDLQKNFFALLQNHTDLNVEETFVGYQLNYNDGSLYANAVLDWLDTEKKDYLLKRNGVLKNSSYKPLIAG